jgi:carbon monoxide dehydrogenase subunit G
MFRIRAEFREDLEIGASVERVRAFLGAPQTFARLMPGVEGISEEGESAAVWVVRADVPLVGVLRESFHLARTDDSASRIEWAPAPGEQKNLLRYAISFEGRGATRCLVRVALRVELRRQRAALLHLMAGLIGERRISAGMQERVEKMMKTFLEGARAELGG